MRFHALLFSFPILAQTAPVDPAAAIISEAQTTLEKRIGAYRAHVAAGQPRATFKWDFSQELASIGRQLAKPQPDPVKEALLVAELGYRVVGRQKVEAEGFDALRRTIPATSPAWAILPSLLTELLENGTDTKAAAAYLAQVRTRNPIPAVRAYLLELQFEEALEAKDEPAWKQALATLEAQHPDSKELASVRRSLDEYRKTAIGTPAPAFSLPDLGNPQHVYTLDSFKGKYVLIDFWATWCSYCRLELPFMHQAWDRFQDKNFEILSLSFDQKPGDITPFRRKPESPMPWKHAFVEGAKKSPVAQAYGVIGIPKAVLVGPDGKIVATDGDLKGKQLEKTLEKLLGK